MSTAGSTTSTTQRLTKELRLYGVLGTRAGLAWWDEPHDVVVHLDHLDEPARAVAQAITTNCPAPVGGGVVDLRSTMTRRQLLEVAPLSPQSRERRLAEAAAFSIDLDVVDTIRGYATWPAYRPGSTATPERWCALAAASLPAGYRPVPVDDAPTPAPDLVELGAAAQTARTQLREAIVAAVAAGTSEAEAARQAGVDRATVRRLLGKGR